METRNRDVRLSHVCTRLVIYGPMVGMFEECKEPLRQPIEPSRERSGDKPRMTSGLLVVQRHAGRDVGALGQEAAGQERIIACMQQ